MTMKKTTAIMAAIIAAAPANADEGMWTMYDLPKQVYEQMAGYGYSLPYGSLYQDGDALMHSVVNFSGFCSGVVVSPDGLVFTNHHCGFEAIRKHSTVEHDYMLNGFYAEKAEDELPCENMFVSFMRKQEDVTPRLKAIGLDGMDKAAKAKLIDSLETALTKEAQTADSTLRVSIDPFYEGNKYYATTYQDFNDLRLVFTIPKSMGKFGGETDNWMWPRQTCDFSVFRVYAAPGTNAPAEYSPENKPYKPAHWAKVSLDGYSEGDFAMTIGYPGSTSRYLSSYGIEEMRSAKNAPRAQVRGVKQEIMAKHMAADEAVRIKYDSKYAQSSNYWKNSIGMNKCIDSIGLVGQKQAYEARIAQWQDTALAEKDRVDFERLAGLYARRKEAVEANMYFGETFIGTNELCTRAFGLNRMEVKGGERKSKQYVQFGDNSDKWDKALDCEVAGALMENYRKHVPAKYLPGFYEEVDSKWGGDCMAYAKHLYDNSAIMDTEPLYVNKKAYKKDPGVVFGKTLAPVRAAINVALDACRDSIALLEKKLCAAKLWMEEDMPHYSDANFTMRLSYGQVGGYSLGGKPSGHYTLPQSIVEKMDKAGTTPDYWTQPVMRELMSATDFKQYADSVTGTLQLCFLTNNDITGGNSGSPMFDGKGRLIGLAFDGNWDSLSSDINFDSRLARCIGVDIRYMLYMMDKWGNAKRLLDEIGVGM